MSAFSAADWKRLAALRDRFLTDASAEYWTPGDLALYDATFAQRIGWKWDAVLAVLDRTGWRPASRRLLDWGCGTGIASRTVAAWAGISEIAVFDQSPAAMAFASDRLRQAGFAPRPAHPHDDGETTLFVASHVIGELEDSEWESLVQRAAACREILWVEPGSRAISRRLTATRDRLRELGHHPVAPCTHDAPCPMNARTGDWCHFFATPPNAIFHSPFWREFSLRLEIDLRALPYSFLATVRTPSPAHPPGAERVIGRPRALKAHCELLCCGAEGLHTCVLQKRDAPELFRRFARDGRDGAFVWEHDPARPHRVVDGREV